MSALLGPIHFLVYEKIQNVDSLTRQILAHAQKQGWNSRLPQMLEEKYDSLEQGNLEDIIDVSGIHGWLHERMQLVEGRLAFAVTALLEGNAGRQSELLAVCRESGRSAGEALASDTTCDMLLQTISTFWTDGMPCDGGVNIQMQDTDIALWSISPNVHAECWNALGEDLSVYWALRDAWTEGFVTGKTVSFEKLNASTFQLKGV